MLILNALVSKTSESINFKTALIINTWSDAARQAAIASRRANAKTYEIASKGGSILGSALDHSDNATSLLDGKGEGSVRDSNHLIAMHHDKAAQQHEKLSRSKGMPQEDKLAHQEAARLHRDAAETHRDVDARKPGVTKKAMEDTSEANKKNTKKAHTEASISHSIAADFHGEHGNEAEQGYHQKAAEYHAKQAQNPSFKTAGYGLRAGQTR